MLHIGIDDTDSVDGGCTTWVATEIIKELSEFDLIGSPRLVRLNPNVPWKTRGNGAVSFTFGKGIGSKQKIGEFQKSEIFAFEKGIDIEYDADKILERLKVLISKKAHLILPTHKLLDAASEKNKGKEKRWIEYNAR